MTALAKMKMPEKILDQSLEDAFPDVNPGEFPFGNLVLIQMKRPAYKTKGGLHLSGNDMQTEYDNTNVAKVIGFGPLCFKSRETGQEWPEGRWFKVGDYVRLSQHNCTTWTVPMPGTRGAGIEERVVFGYIDELHVRGLVLDPLATQAFF
jgi:hypothetical protein